MANTLFVELHNGTISKLPRERWIPLKGFSGIYEISSHGRIRSLERKIAAMNRWNQTIRRLKPGMIRKQKLRARYNPLTHKTYYECDVSLWKNNKEYGMRVSRLVYEHFVGKLSAGLFITHIDGDGRNNHYKNLAAMDMSHIRRLAYADGRQVNVFALMSGRQKKRIYRSLSIKAKRAVQRVNAEGRVLKNFESIEEAAKDAPCDRSYMTQVLKGRKEHVKGKFYRYKA